MQNRLSEITISSTKQAITAGFPTLATIRRETSDNQVKAFLIYHITAYVEFINVGKSMNASQIIETAKFILQYYSYLTMADVQLFFDRMKIGRYGKTFDRVDGQVIMERLELYNQERMQEYEGIQHEKHNEQKKQDVVRQLHPKILEAIKNAIPPKKVENYQPAQVREQSEFEQFNQKCIRQFNNLYKAFAVPGLLRRIKIGDQYFTLETFVARKIKNSKYDQA